MAKSTSQLQQVPIGEPEPAAADQRYLHLFEQLSLLIGNHDTGEVSVRACESIAQLLEVGACSIAMLNEDGTALDLLAATHIKPDSWPHIKLTVAGGIYEPVLSRRESLLIRDAKDFESHFHRKPDTRHASASCVVVPLITQDRTVGVINVAHPLSRPCFDRRDVDLLAAVARVVGSALLSTMQYRQAVLLQKKLTDLFNRLHVGIVVVDDKMRITESNRRAQKLFQFEQKGRPKLEEALHGTVYNVCCRLIRQIEDKQIEAADDGLELKRGDESKMLKIRAIRSMDALIGEHLIMIDEAGQEEEVRRLRESENAKHSFLAIISHELRTPLTVIKAALPMLEVKEKPTPPEIMKQVHQLLSNNCHRLSEVVNSILYVTEIESGTLELAMRPTDIHKLLSDTILRNTTSATQKRVKLSAALNAGQPEIVADGQRLGTVFSELIHNAIKFSDPDTEISIQTGQTPPWFEVVIRNVGQCIDPNKRSDIFEKFVQGNQSLTRSVGGCGLGLFLVYNIVRLHGGMVELLESDQKVTTFRVRLPLDRPGEAPPEGAGA
jgi:signal transduction histidine kinase